MLEGILFLLRSEIDLTAFWCDRFDQISSPLRRWITDSRHAPPPLNFSPSIASRKFTHSMIQRLTHCLHKSHSETLSQKQPSLPHFPFLISSPTYPTLNSSREGSWHRFSAPTPPIPTPNQIPTSCPYPLLLDAPSPDPQPASPPTSPA